MTFFPEFNESGYTYRPQLVQVGNDVTWESLAAAQPASTDRALYLSAELPKDGTTPLEDYLNAGSPWVLKPGLTGPIAPGRYALVAEVVEGEELFVPVLPAGMTDDTTTRYWELQPGSDTPGDRIVPWQLFSTAFGYQTYACLVDITSAGVIPGSNADDHGLALAPADTAWDIVVWSSIQLKNPGDSYQPGRYMASYFTPTGEHEPPPLPLDWTPVEGPKFLTNEINTPFWAGRVRADEDFSLPSNWVVAPPTTPLTYDGVNNASWNGVVAQGQEYVAVWAPDPPVAPSAWPTGVTPLTSVTGPIAITDENAGGVIGDIAYVVSGYVYNNRDALGTTHLRWIGILNEGINDVLAGDVFGALNDPGTYYVAGIDGTATSVGGDFTSSSADISSFTNGFWPYLERYDLKAKTWLPRIKLPEAKPTGLVAKITGTLEEPVLTVYGYGSVPVISEVTFIDSSDNNTVGYIDPVVTGTANEWSIATGTRFEEGTLSSLEDVVRIFLLMDGSSVNIETGSNGTVVVGEFPIYASEGGFAGVINGKLYFGGGDGGSITGKEFFSYDPATQEFDRLPDLDSFYYPDYNPYGVVGGSVWWLTSGAAWSFTPGDTQWVEHTAPEMDINWGDQLQGVEIGGKLYFVYDRVYVFDPVALTVEAKAESPNAISNTPATAFFENKVLVSSVGAGPEYETSMWLYNPVSDSFAIPDWVNAPYVDYGTFAMHESIPYVTSGYVKSVSDGNSPGIVGLTGNQPTQGEPVTEPDPDPQNHRNPAATENRFSGLYPDNDYPLVDGELDEVQQQRLQARQESDRTPRESSDDPYADHPPLTEKYNTNDHVLRRQQEEEAANA